MLCEQRWGDEKSGTIAPAALLRDTHLPSQGRTISSPFPTFSPIQCKMPTYRAARNKTGLSFETSPDGGVHLREYDSSPQSKVRDLRYKKSLISGTTLVCSIAAPAGARRLKRSLYYRSTDLEGMKATKRVLQYWKNLDQASGATLVYEAQEGSAGGSISLP